VDPTRLIVSGLGVCGSGRQIAGLHALTDGVINEIIAHATAAVYFDPDVDTIFEIGGQDAKYTFITNAVPSDYAMNEACSAGTGSFLEESAFETLGVPMEDIAAIARTGLRPPNFNDQCAAFIASDIKNSIHEGIDQEDIVAGLVYSICMNYTNRVKGNRPVGAKVFMQGGVCYNRAVPLAMAALVGKPIVVPPEPGLMGAFGVALEAKKRIELGLLKDRIYDLETLADRTVTYKKSFTCRGGKEKCDRRCEINTIQIEGKTYPFGGACNRYYNLRQNIKHDTRELDLVRHRQHLVYETYGAGQPKRTGQYRRGRIGLNRSFLVNTYYPLYANFFSELGFEPVLPEVPSPEGINQKNAPFCYPAELAHGFFAALLEQEMSLDYVFLPHFKAIPAQNGYTNSQVCPFVQGETFFLQATFGRKIRELQQKGVQLLTPMINLSKGLDHARKPLVETAVQMGLPRREAEKAFGKALQQQINSQLEMKRAGREALAELETDPDKIAVIIFARPYSGFVEEAHMGIPSKIASRGIRVLPFDFLSFDDEKAKVHMYWGMGQLLLQAARVVKRHPQLFGAYITNFSCGPDSFLLGYFRDIMGRKPSLTLELDSHTADAGLETRIEAFLDIVAAYRQLLSAKKIVARPSAFVPARTLMQNGEPKVITSKQKSLAMNDPRVTLLFPSMGQISTQALAAVFRGKGYQVVAHPPSDEAVLKLGRANTSCKECLPLILTTGTLLNYVNNGKRPDEVIVYFMPTGSGPCRFGQYRIFMEDLVRRHELPNVAIFSLTSENSYLGLGTDFQRRGWWAVVVSDVMEDVRSMILANAGDADSAMNVFQEEWRDILAALEYGEFARLENQLEHTALRLGRIALKIDPAEVPKISLAGEIFVRRDYLSRQYLTERLAKNGFACICSPVAEWLYYSNYLMDIGLSDYRMTGLERLEFFVKKNSMSRYERRIKSILSRSGLVEAEPVDITHIIRNASPFISPNLGGEAILTVGSAMSEIATLSCGVIAIGPFGCMPNRLAEAILNETMNRRVKLAVDRENPLLHKTLADMEELPFLAVESDGSPFPQIINAKLESFCLRAGRLHQRMLSARQGAGKKKKSRISFTPQQTVSPP
jgi:predicted CoA-substrate-specific enzyme activase